MRSTAATSIIPIIAVLSAALLLLPGSGRPVVGAFSPAVTTHRRDALRSTTTSGYSTGTGTPSALEMAVGGKKDRTMSQELLDLLNSQVTKELSASQLYLSASIWCEQRDLVGMAAYMRHESEEERSHALDFIDFANKKNIPLHLEDIDAPDMSWSTVEELWEDVLQCEVDNTRSLLEIGDAAADCRDHAVSTFLQPYHMVSPVGLAINDVYSVFCGVRFGFGSGA